MRLEPKPAAALCAAAFVLLLIFGAAWPGPGLWLLAAALISLAGAAGTWWLDAAPAHSAATSAQRVAHTPFAATPGRSRAAVGRSVGQFLPQRGPDGRWTMPDQVHLAFVVGACGLLALILFIGGAIGGGDDGAATAAVELDANPAVIDLSRDGDPSALPTPAASTAPIAQPAQTPTTGAAATPAAAASTTVAPPATQPRPIVVADPKPATPVELKPREAEPTAAPPARTVQHTVVEGDSLYAIALEYDTTVDAITALNDITADTILHLGDVLLIPQPDE